MAASATSGRFEFRVRPELKHLIERVASLTHQTASDFARTAAEERAVEVLREHELITRVPADFFDELLASLDAPVEPNDALTRAAAWLDSVIERR
ncbi:MULTISPECIES: type II toxin-antitoxin system TacA family antitoxin [unclassified Frankia]|uniref:type II toxin-antitoxin system TacA family antitoxin n=1 Tax=unclassified Frankia TaxID=2632575 RepID=UPI002024E08B